MKIIADMNSGKKLVEVTENELAQILGFKTTYESGFDRNMIAIGKDIDIAKFTKVSNFVKTINTSHLSNITDRLNGAIKEVTTAIDLADELNVFDKLKG